MPRLASARACACAAAVAAMAWAPVARADFGCFEWPSMTDPSATVQYVVSGSCAEDVAALSLVEGFAHLRDFGTNASESECSNSEGMIFLAELCNATADALEAAFPDKAVAAEASCDGGHLTLQSTESCVALSDVLARLVGKATTTLPTTVPTDGAGDPQGGGGAAPQDGFFEHRDARWVTVFVFGCVALMLGVVMIALLAAKGIRKYRLDRKAGGFHASNRRQVKVKQGVYSGVDELGFTADEIKGMEADHQPRGRLSSVVAQPAPQPQPAGTPAANVRYHHPDWCASAPPSPPSASGAPASAGKSPSSAKKVLKVQTRRRLSTSNLLPVPPAPPAGGYDSDDQSLLLY